MSLSRSARRRGVVAAVPPVVANTTFGSNSGANNMTLVNHVVPAGARLVVLGVYRDPTPSELGAASVVWNGTENLAAVRVVTSSIWQAELWFLANPTATTANVVITYNAGAPATEFAAWCGALSITGAKNVVAVHNGNNNTGTSLSVSLASCPLGSLVLAAFGHQVGEDGVPVAPAIELFDVNVGGNRGSFNRQNAADGGLVSTGETWATSAANIAVAGALEAA